MLENIYNSVSQFSILEWIGLFTGLIYVVLSAQNKVSCWFFGIISCACIAYHDFFGSLMLYSDGVLQIFYIILGCYGIYQWRRKKMTIDIDVKDFQILKNHLLIVIICVLLSIIYGYLMQNFTNTAIPYLDAFTTIFSIAATILLVNRQLSAWIYFIVIDFIMCYVYFVRDWELYAFLYFIYFVVAVFAVWNWQKVGIKNKSYLESI